MTVADRVLGVLAHVSEINDVRQNPDARLYDLQILDSMKTVELIVALSTEFAVSISPAELTADLWATPRQIVAFVEGKVAG